MFPLFKSRGILGLNARSLLYIKPFNPKKVTALADDKLKTKAFLAARGIPVAKMYGRIDTREQARTFDYAQLPNECVLKPNNGFGGEGIIIIRGRSKSGAFLRNGKEPIKTPQLREHIEDILDGKFALSGRPDSAFFEQILIPHNCFARFRPVGLPDLRIIVFNLIPVMAMLRIPTSASDGKANLHLGGIGIGIDIAKGTTTHAAQYHSTIQTLPHGEKPSGHQIPYWDDILLVCSKIQQITNIGYLAVDITIDEQMGPALLEVNARAGLNVQLANLAPLRSRLERVKGVKVSSPEKGVRMGQDLFGEKAKKTKKENGTTEEKPTLGLKETIVMNFEDGTTMEIPCRIASDEERTTFAPDLLSDLVEKGGAEVESEEEQTYRLKFSLCGKKIQTLVAAKSMPHGSERAIIGLRDLKGFLIDPSKDSTEKKSAATSVKTDLRAADRMLAQLDRDLLLLKHLKPVNLEEEMQRLREDRLYNPTLLYPNLETDLQEALKWLSKPIDESETLGILLEKKRKELLARIALLRARGRNDEFTQCSKDLFGTPTSQLISSAESVLRKRVACDLPPPQKQLISAEKAAPLFEEVLKRYSLHNWTVSVRTRLVADCTVGGNKVYIRAGAHFTKENIASLIAHEIETHVLTAENGEHQPYHVLRRGCAGYLDTQEGLAIFNQNAVLSPFAEKRFNPPRNMVGCAWSMEHSLAETRAYLEEELGYTHEKALTQSLAMKRGCGDTATPGGFTKSVVYYRGLRAIEKFVRDGGDIKRLYLGKVALEDLELIEKLPDLQPPLLLPEFLRES